MIEFISESGTFFLTAGQTSYVFTLYENGRILSLYYGRRLPASDMSYLHFRCDRAFSPNPSDASDRSLSMDTIPAEYPTACSGDFRTPALEVLFTDGARSLDLRCQSHTIQKGKAPVHGLPHTWGGEEDCETLCLCLKDIHSGLQVELYYTVFNHLNAIVRRAEIVNGTESDVRLNKAMSLSLPLPDKDYSLLNLYGAHCRERQIDVTPLFHGTQSIESRRGASSHMQNPFLTLLRPHTTETHGEAYGFNLVYSGNHLMEVEVDQFDTVRVQCGINPFDFSWLLTPGERFVTPECVMAYSSDGLGDLSRTFHDLYMNHLCRSAFTKQPRPIIINNWEATYFDFNQQKLFDFIDSCKGLGIDTFVLDDGWFGQRDDDCSSLGDWTVDFRKLPGGLTAIIDRCKQNGMSFGLWFEPEMVSEKSRLFKAHPDWAIGAPNRPRSTGRSQLILDLSRPEVCEYVINAVCDILAAHDISYVKWDMNRHMTECCSAALPANRQQELPHRYMLGLYSVMDAITARFPDVLFESCSGGGGRFDPGMLYYMPQTWTSDNSDAVERLRIQYGTSLVYPPASIVGHVSVVPNHQTGRVTPVSSRSNIAMCGAFGYELNPLSFTEEERALVKENNAYYKSIQDLILHGRFYRLMNPFTDDRCAWMQVSEDKKRAVVMYMESRVQPASPVRYLHCQGLEENTLYYIAELDACYSGAALMYAGLPLPCTWGEYFSLRYTLTAVEDAK